MQFLLSFLLDFHLLTLLSTPFSCCTCWMLKFMSRLPSVPAPPGAAALCPPGQGALSHPAEIKPSFLCLAANHQTMAVRHPRGERELEVKLQSPAVYEVAQIKTNKQNWKNPTNQKTQKQSNKKKNPTNKHTKKTPTSAISWILELNFPVLFQQLGDRRGCAEVPELCEQHRVLVPSAVLAATGTSGTAAQKIKTWLIHVWHKGKSFRCLWQFRDKRGFRQNLFTWEISQANPCWHSLWCCMELDTMPF